MTSVMDEKFLGSRIFITSQNMRKELPIKQEDKPVAIWKIIRKFIG